MYDLPTTVLLGDTTLTVRNRGDYRTVLDCFKALEDIDLTKTERVYACLIIFYEELNSVEDVNGLPDIELAYKEMVRFFNCGRDNVGAHAQYKVIDWEKDSMLICSAINNVAQTEIRSLPYLHWWTFMGYYLSIGECSLSTIVGIRAKRAKGQKLEKYEQKFVRDNPEYFWSMQTVEQQEIDAEIRKMWKSEGT